MRQSGGYTRTPALTKPQITVFGSAVWFTKLSRGWVFEAERVAGRSSGHDLPC